MQTTVEIEETLLRQAKEQARKQGKSFDHLLEDALRKVVTTSMNQQTYHPTNSVEALEPNDPFFAALDEIRAFGRTAAPSRPVDLSE